MSSTPSLSPGPGVLVDPNMSHLNDLSRVSSKASSEASLQRIKNLPGYTTPVFKGKEEQRATVQADVASKVPIHSPSCQFPCCISRLIHRVSFLTS